MFRHQVPSSGSLITTKDQKSITYFGCYSPPFLPLKLKIKDLIVIKLEDGNLVPKHAGVGTYHEAYFIMCVLLYFT